MALVRRHWKLAVLNALILLLGVSLFVGHLMNHAPMAGSTETTAAANGPLTRQTRPRIAELRRKLCLENEDLAAMACSEDDAKRVLNALLSWYSQNQASLDAARHQEESASIALQAAQRKIRMGPRDEATISQLPTFETNLQSAVQQEKQLLQAAKTVLAQQLSSSQNNIWSAAIANIAGPDQYRYVPGLSTEQLTSLSKTVRHFGAGSPQVVQIEQTTLVGAKAIQAEAAAANLKQYMPTVLAAERSTLAPSTAPAETH